MASCTRYNSMSGLVSGLWFSLGTAVSFTYKAGRHDITEILLIVALNTMTITYNHILILKIIC